MTRGGWVADGHRRRGNTGCAARPREELAVLTSVASISWSTT